MARIKTDGLPEIEQKEEEFQEADEIVDAFDAPKEETTEVDDTEETPLEEEEEEAPTDEEEEDATDKQKAEAFDSLVSGLTKDKVGQLAALIDNLQLSETQKAELFARAIGQTITTTATGEGWEDDVLTEPEKVVKKHKTDIETLPALKQQIGQDFQTVGGYISELAYHNAVLTAQLNSVMEHSGLKLPVPDRKAIDNLVGKGKTYQEAIDELYVPKASKVTKLATKKRDTETPTTLKSASGDTQELGLKPGDSLHKHFEAAKKLLNLN